MNEPVIVLTKGEVSKLIKEAVKEGISQAMTQLKGSPNKKLLLTRGEAANFLGCSVWSIDNWRRSGKLPVSYINRHPRFKKSDLLKLMEDNSFGYISALHYTNKSLC